MYLRQGKRIHTQHSNTLHLYTQASSCSTQHTFNFWQVCTVQLVRHLRGVQDKAIAILKGGLLG